MSQECYNLVSLLVTSQGYCHLMKALERWPKCRRTELWNNLGSIYRQENGQIIFQMSQTTVIKQKRKSVSTKKKNARVLMVM